MRSYNCCNSKSKESKQITALSSLLKIVGEENRLRLLYLLDQGEHCVCEIKGYIKLSQSLISHHLKDLKDTGLVHDKKRGLYVYYSLTDKGSFITKKLFSITSKEDKK